jgi:hypothetical protein
MVTVDQHFTRVAPSVAAMYRRLLTKTRALGPFTEVPNKSSIHLVRRTIFAGVATRQKALLLTLKAEADVKSPRVEKHDQVSANRWHLRIRLSGPKEIDRELLRWLKAAYTLGAEGVIGRQLRPRHRLRRRGV